MPTPVFCCGFECGGLGAASTTGLHWWQAQGATSGITTQSIRVRSGTRSAHFQPAGAEGYIRTPVGLISSQKFAIRFYVYFTTLPSAHVDIFSVGTAGASTSWGVKYDSGNLLFSHDGTGLSSAPFSVTTNVWYRVELYFDMSGTSHTRTLLVDGTLVYHSFDFIGTAFTADCIHCGPRRNSMSADFAIDDVIVSYTLSDFPFGPGFVNHFHPVSDGSHNIAGTGDFMDTAQAVSLTNATTNAHALLAQIPITLFGTFIQIVAPPNAADYVECVFGPCPGISTPVIPPRAVECIIAIAQSGTGAGNMEVRLNDNGTNNAVYSATGVAGSTTVIYKRKHYATPPSGSSWKVVSGNGNFNNLRMRLGSPGAVDANPDQYLGAFMIEAEFSSNYPQKIISINQALKRAAYH